jgi:5-methylcytosine-specific restriction endonuclease McrA
LNPDKVKQLGKKKRPNKLRERLPRSATKVCITCGKENKVDNFPKNPRMDDGHLNRCKSCEYTRVKEWRKLNRARVKFLQDRWRKDNPEQFKQHLVKYQRKTVEKRNAARRKRYENNREKEIAMCRAYQKGNVEYQSRKNATRRVAHVNATPRWLTAIQKAQMAESYEISKAKTFQTGIRHHVDHIVPLRGNGVAGLHVPWNMQILTGTENNRKFNSLPKGEG